MRFKANDLEQIAEKLDISPTMYDYAVARYKGIAQYLADNGIDADFYPQGSFRTGTVVRPVKNGIETDYDLDVICNLSVKKDFTSPRQIKISVGDALRSNQVYKEKLLPEDSRCWTLKYAGISNDVGFSLDIVPSVRESSASIQALIYAGVPTDLAAYAESITEKQPVGSYSWLPSNPKGFGGWFDQINEPFKAYDYEGRRKKYFDNNRAQFRADAVVESVPEYHIKSGLQRSIQLLKRHRDLFYQRVENGEALRPASVIITSLAAKAAAGESPSLPLDILLKHIVYGLRDYASLLQGKQPALRFDGDVRNIIQKQAGKWIIPNPVNPNDNYADSWTTEMATMFFKWIDAVVKDLADTAPNNESQYISGLRRSFGTLFVNSSLSLKETSERTTTPLSTPTRPWSL